MFRLGLFFFLCECTRAFLFLHLFEFHFIFFRSRAYNILADSNSRVRISLICRIYTSWSHLSSHFPLQARQRFHIFISLHSFSVDCRTTAILARSSCIIWPTIQVERAKRVKGRFYSSTRPWRPVNLHRLKKKVWKSIVEKFFTLRYDKNSLNMIFELDSFCLHSSRLLLQHKARNGMSFKNVRSRSDSLTLSISFRCEILSFLCKSVRALI